MQAHPPLCFRSDPPIHLMSLRRDGRTSAFYAVLFLVPATISGVVYLVLPVPRCQVCRCSIRFNRIWLVLWVFDEFMMI
jgi:hypothetical protein